MKPSAVAAWVAQGVPGVYEAARHAGLGRLDAYRVLQASGWALVIAKRRFPRRWREENAVRHFVWQAWLTATYGRSVAAAIGAAHERIATDLRDSAVDQQNNRVAQEYGASHAPAITATAMRPSLSALADEAARQFAAGHLSVERPDGG
jgi:hypothetical protein